jgi:deoxyxylulose-5-phosphate synthase
MGTVVGAMDPTVRVVAHGIPDRFVLQASRARQLALTGLDAEGIARRVRALYETEALAG